MNKQRRYLLILALLGLVATALPWVKASAGAFGYSVSSSANGFSGWGLFYLLLMAVVAVVSGVLGDRTQRLDATLRIVVLLSGAVGALSVLLYFSNLPSGFSSSFGGVSVGPSIGAILAFAVAAGIVAVPLVSKKPGESLQGDFKQFRQQLQAKIPTPSGTPDAPGNSGISRMDELEKLLQWRAEGTISEAEFQDMKRRILGD